MKALARKNKAGFTLVELLVSMSIGLAVLAALTGTFITQSKHFNVQEQTNEMQQNGRAAVDIMVREIKMAGYRPNGGSFDGVALSTSYLRIKADLDGSGSITSNSNEEITYTFDYSNKKIERNGVTLAENIDNFTFEYRKADGTIATSASEIRQVKINITARTAKPDPDYSANSGYRTYQLEGQVTPPNLGL